MSGANAWLQRQRKAELVELAQQSGLTNYESFKKAELELALDEFLAENSTQFIADPKFAPYYSSRNRAAGSPIKRDLDDKPRVSKRRLTKAIEEAPTLPAPAPESSEEEPMAISTSTAIAHTPARALSLASRIPLPATPADVAEAVDRSTVAVRNRVSVIYKESGVTEATRATREYLSSVNAVLALVSVFELYFLRHEVLPDRYAFTIPALQLLGTKDYPVMIPDLFLLLTTSFWSPTFLWACTSAILPTLFGYFFNLSVAHQSGRRTSRNANPSPDYTVDPMTFSIVKALLSFVVYGQNVTFGGWFSEESIARVNGAVYGGWKGVLVGTAVTGLFSVYDAVLKK
ncbi:cupin -type protein [Apiospora kogelbergensis]|uniref:Cupin -type protein n=1 Tax=Apiospora kogelbergensis TaxID=1337665 RepID=A0AAW0QUL2_9PEZI